MKTYTKPMMDITSYEAEKIMFNTSSVGIQSGAAINSVKYNTINFN